jgi:chromosome segregation ATPase
MHDTLTTRHAQLTAERETATRRYQQQTVMLDGRITQLRAELAELEQARQDAQTRYERQDYAYAAVIGELAGLLKQDEVNAPPSA